MEPSTEHIETISKPYETQNTQLEPDPVDSIAQDNTTPATECRSQGSSGVRLTKKPLKHVAFVIFCRWFVSAVLAGSIYLVLKVYSDKTTISQAEKRTFNALITGLSIGLGLAIAEGLEDLIGDLRWWILSRRYRSFKEVASILEADRTRYIIALCLWSRRTTTKLAAWTWVVILAASQIGVASLGLCYSTDLAERQARTAPGMVAIPDMTEIQTAAVISNSTSKISAQQYTANSFGTVSLAYNSATLGDIPKPRQIWWPDDPLVFCGDTVCRYILHESSTVPTLPAGNEVLSPITVTTDRSLDVSAVCDSWPVINENAGNGIDIAVNTTNGVVTIPISNLEGLERTIYMTNTSQTCGLGCTIVSALEASAPTPWYYHCNVTVGAVSGATIPEQEVGDDLRSMASGSIALRGYDVTSAEAAANSQYQIYPAESIFGTPQDGSTEGMASLLSRFTIGVVAIAAENNDQLIVEGDTPFLGEQLNVPHMDIIIIILVLIVVVQLALGVIIGALTSRIVIPCRGSLELAQVCSAITNAMKRDSEGSNASSEQFWIFRNKNVASDGVYEVYMEAQNLESEKRPVEDEITRTTPDVNEEEPQPRMSLCPSSDSA